MQVRVLAGALFCLGADMETQLFGWRSASALH